jgi:hypothetical protein
MGIGRPFIHEDQISPRVTIASTPRAPALLQGPDVWRLPAGFNTLGFPFQPFFGTPIRRPLRDALTRGYGLFKDRTKPARVGF